MTLPRWAFTVMSADTELRSDLLVQQVGTSSVMILVRAASMSRDNS